MKVFTLSRNPTRLPTWLSASVRSLIKVRHRSGERLEDSAASEELWEYVLASCGRQKSQKPEALMLREINRAYTGSDRRYVVFYTKTLLSKSPKCEEAFNAQLFMARADKVRIVSHI
jgi:hypothetical protein